MDALGLLLRARLRRWRGWVSLCLLAGLLSGLVLAAVSAGHRTATAFPQFVAAHGYDALVISAAPMPALATPPDVASATRGARVRGRDADVRVRASHQPRVLQPVRGGTVGPAANGQAGGRPDAQPELARRGAGVVPDAAGHRRRRRHRHPRAAVLRGAAERVPERRRGHPGGGTVTLRVVGIEAAEAEFPFAATPSYALYTTTAFSRLWPGGPRASRSPSCGCAAGRPRSPGSRHRRARPGRSRCRTRTPRSARSARRSGLRSWAGGCWPG